MGDTLVSVQPLTTPTEPKKEPLTTSLAPTPEPAPEPAKAPEPPKAQDTPPAPEPAKAPEPPKDAAPTPKSIEKWTKEFAETGKLSDESLADAAKAYDLTPDDVREFVEFRHSQQVRLEQAGYEAAGGQERFSKIAEVVGKEMTEEERNAYLSEVNSARTPAAVQAAVKKLVARYEAKHGRDPAPIATHRAASTGTKGFESLEQAVAMRRDPRFQSDPAFRKEYDARWAATHN